MEGPACRVDYPISPNETIYWLLITPPRVVVAVLTLDRTIKSVVTGPALCMICRLLETPEAQN